MGYRETILANVAAKPTHPVNQGIKMQAHHLVSKKGLKLSKMKTQLNKLGYDINVAENLVLLPSTLKGACHLGVQLHRGNHPSSAGDFATFEDSDDSDSAFFYHVEVAVALKAVKSKIDKGNYCKQDKARVQALINGVSKNFLFSIATFVAPLTGIHKSFAPGMKSGCCGKNVIPEVKAAIEAKGSGAVCPKGRNHQGQEKITHRGGPYTLRAGQ